MDEFNQRFIDLSINNPVVPNRYVGINSLSQLDSVLNRFSASLKTIELNLDSLEVNKFTENITAENIWLDKFELLQSDVDLQREIHALINEKCNSILSSLDNEDDAVYFTRKIDEINYRWNSIRVRIIALRNYLDTNDEQSKQLLISIRELIDWIAKIKVHLNNSPISAGDVITAAKQKNDHRILINKVEDKRPIIESTLLAGRHFLEAETIETDYADYDLIECIRREIKKLSEKWMELCQHVENKERILEDIYLNLNSLQKQLDDASKRLHNAELNKAKLVPINEITNEKITAHLAELKTFKERIFPLQNNIEQVNSLANLITQCNLPLSKTNINHLDELNTRWKLLQLSLEERQKALERTAPLNSTVTTEITNTVNDIQNIQMLNLATPHPWERQFIPETKVPYYLNHVTKATQYNHPKMTEFLTELAKFTNIRYAAYRLAVKLRSIQKLLGFDQIYVHNLNAIFDQYSLKNDGYITVTEMINFFNSVYNTILNSSLINTSLCIDLSLNLMLNLYDTPARMGKIKVISFKIVLIVFCRATIDEKYSFMFKLVADSNGLVDEQKLTLLFQSLLQIPTYLNEAASFAGPILDYSIRSCLERANKYEIEFRDFLHWTKLEPQSLVWLAVFHRMIRSESTKHLNYRCRVCNRSPIIGLRLKCLKCFNTDFCQDCFFYGHNNVRGHKLTHPLQEYSSTTTTGENVLDFTRIICNKFKPKNLFMRRNYYGQMLQNANTNDYMMMQNGLDSIEQQQQLMYQQQALAYQQQANQMNQLNTVNQMNQLNTVNQMNQLNTANQMNQLNSVNQMNQLNSVNQMNQLNSVNQMNQLNSINQIPNTINQQTLPINQISQPVNTLAPNQLPLNQSPLIQTTPLNSINQNNLTIPQTTSTLVQSPVINTSSSLQNQIVAQQIQTNQPVHSRPIQQTNSLTKNGIYYNHNNFNNDYYMINSTRSPAQILDSIDNQQRVELEDIVTKLEEQNRALQMEYERLKHEKLNAAKHQANSNWSNMMMNTIEEELNNNIAYIQRREDALTEANALKHYRDQLERRMEILEEHNHQLEDQLHRLKMILNNDQTLNGSVLHSNEKHTTSILKNPTNQLPRSTNKSIHFSKNTVDDFDSIR